MLVTYLRTQEVRPRKWRRGMAKLRGPTLGSTT